MVPIEFDLPHKSVLISYIEYVYLSHISRLGVANSTRPYLEGFIEAVLALEPMAFVLLVVNGGDAPLTRELQERSHGHEIQRYTVYHTVYIEYMMV